MAVLQLSSGGPVGTQYPVEGARVILGRHPTCQIILENGAISRRHAQILESHGTYYIEDLRSRNKTFVNGTETVGRQELQDGDQIRICDMVLTFLYHPSTAVPVTHADGNIAETFVPPEGMSSVSLDESSIYALPVEDPGLEEEFDNSTSIRKLDTNAPSKVDPNVKLRAILEITRALSRELALDKVLPKLLETLFNIFPQAEQGFVLLKDHENNKLKVKASRARGGTEADSVAVSMTVVRHALQTGEAILSENVSDDSRFKGSTALTKMRIRSIMCVPMVGQDEQEGFGVIQIVTRDESNAFNEEDLDLLVSLTSQASMKVENARLHEEDVRRHELERDLEFATQVQLGFLPKSRPKLEHYEFADYYEAAQSVGGDYFDYLTLPDGRVVLTIGDVAGKGMPAALLMARLYSSTRFQLLTQTSLEDAVTGLNEEIASSGLGHRFITFLLMAIDPKTDELQIVNAGHLNPLLLRDGEVIAIGKEGSGLPLGIVPDMQYQSSMMQIEPGDTIIAFTDGVTEEMNPNRDIFGVDRLTQCLISAEGNMTDVVQSIIAEVDTFANGNVSHDDTCLIGVRRTKQ